MHIILESIGRSQHLQARMVMKGGLLMAMGRVQGLYRSLPWS
ncbi:MAG: hypothetical protein Q8S92_21355 [Hydrogenophaga sp.]|nr:hypothetical protein [Hydrogenophaga sp.]MDP3351544.1 hypothetical protein [Hydrogenophaga sp.]